MVEELTEQDMRKQPDPGQASIFSSPPASRRAMLAGNEVKKSIKSHMCQYGTVVL
jgi:hypothetical protein